MGFNRLAKVEYPMPTLGSGASNPGDAEAFTLYDANNNLKSKTKRDGTTVIDFSYDLLNRRITKTFPATPSANVSYAYDAAGRPLSALFANVGGTPGVTWTYDAAGRRITEATNGRSLAFAYDSDSNPHTLTWPDSASITYAYDTADRFASVSNSAFSVAAGYDTLSRVNALTRPSSSSTLGYDPADRVTSLAHAFTPTTGNETWTLGFTAGGQLASSASTNAAWDWAPSLASSIATVPDGLNRNASVGGTSWVYDKNGNLTSDGTRTFTYDAENRLITESGPVAMTLAYDPTGRLQQSVVSGIKLNFLYDGDALVGEYNGSGALVRRYVHGPEVDDPLVWFEGASMTSASAHYLIADRQGSITATANSSGAITANYPYDAYGVPSAWGSVGTTPRFRYTGQAVISAAKLYYYKARVYDPTAGKFLQTDPVGDQSDLNLYAYVQGDPLNRTDPTGNAERIIIDSFTHEITILVPYEAKGTLSSAAVAAAIRTVSQKVNVGGSDWQVKVIPINGALINKSFQLYRNEISGDPSIEAGLGKTTGIGFHAGVSSYVGTLSGQFSSGNAGTEISKAIAHEIVGHGGGLGDAYDISTGRSRSRFIGNLMSNDPSNGTRLTSGQIMQMTSPSSGNEIVYKSSNEYRPTRNPTCILGVCF